MDQCMSMELDMPGTDPKQQLGQRRRVCDGIVAAISSPPSVSGCVKFQSRVVQGLSTSCFTPVLCCKSQRSAVALALCYRPGGRVFEFCRR